MKIGMGYDVHKLVENRDLILGGVKIPYELGLLGHSDADVLLHAIMDSLLGASALGDIGKHFPDTDEKYKDISSIELLKHVGKLLEQHNYIIGNIDATIIAQRPKMAPHIPDMRKNIANALNISLDQINVKATTEEGLGFTGEGLGISSQAICLIQNKKSEEIAKFIIEFIKEKNISIYDEKTGKGLVRHIVTKVGIKTGEIMCVIVINGHKIPNENELVENLKTKYPEIKAIVKNINMKNTNVILGQENINLYGNGYIEDILGEYKFKISPLSFYQVNPVQAEKLYDLGVSMAEITKNDIVFDLYCGIGTIGLMKGVNTFNSEKKIKLATYASRCIENEILMHLRKTQRTRQEYSLDEVLSIDSEGNEMILSDIISSNETLALTKMTEEEDVKNLYYAIDKLTPREKEIVIMRYGLYGEVPLTQKEVADKLGISQSYISRLEKRIIDKMRQEIENLVKIA